MRKRQTLVVFPREVIDLHHLNTFFLDIHI